MFLFSSHVCNWILLVVDGQRWDQLCCYNREGYNIQNDMGTYSVDVATNSQM